MLRKLIGLVTLVLVLGGVFAGLAPATGTAQDQELEAQGRGRGVNGPDKAASYINPDKGLATFNPNVDGNSECRNPDQKDVQQVSRPGSTANNVHNDACLFRNNKKVDFAVSFVLKGVGVFNACPDPDRGGPKVAFITDGGKRCYQSGYQATGGTVAGDKEYHARVNSTQPGTSKVIFCWDPNNNGCNDAPEKGRKSIKDRIRITWVA